ncbi:MAG: DUF2177 family protein [Sphingomonadales bacterium]|nr:DUF2177 family protein [Sphingomonadales bacterium]
MKLYAITYIVFLLAFVGADFLWLGWAGNTIYRPAMGDMALSGFRMAPAAAFYLLYAAGAVALAIVPGAAAGGWLAAGLRGAVFGLCAYGTYDLTNQATLKHWSTTLSLVDMTWGALLTGAAAALAVVVARSVNA